MLIEKLDGVSLNNNVALNTLKNIKHFAKLNPTVYLPSHDPESSNRLRNNETVFENESDLVIGWDTLHKKNIGSSWYCQPDLHLSRFYIGIREIIKHDEWSVGVYLNVNNHYEGCAPMTIEKVVKLIPG